MRLVTSPDTANGRASLILIPALLLAFGCRPAAEPAPEAAPAVAQDSQRVPSSECDVDIPPPVEPDPPPEEAQPRMKLLAQWAESPVLTCPPGTRPQGPPLPVRNSTDYPHLVPAVEGDEQRIGRAGVVKWNPDSPTKQSCIDAAGNGHYRIAAIRDGEYEMSEAGELRGGTLHGAALQWWSRGSIMATAWFHEGKLHGELSTFSSNGMPEGFQTFRHGNQHGIETFRHANGAVMRRWSWKEGRRHGPWLSYYPDGTLEQDVAYIDHSSHGLAREWWPNGQLRVRARYCEGRQFGEQEAFHENGARSSWAFFRDGEREGEQLDFNEKGEVTHRYFYRRGRNVGGLRPGAPRFSDFHDEPTPSASKGSKAPTQPEDER